MNVQLPHIRSLAATVALLSLSACATPIATNIDVADGVDASQFKTYAWVPDASDGSSLTEVTGTVNSAGFLSPVNQQRIRVSIEQELARKGYVKAPKSSADIALAFNLGAVERRDVRNDYQPFGYRSVGFYNGFGYGGVGRFGRRGGRFGLGAGYRNVPIVRNITEGTLVVDVFDNREKVAIWRGAATKRLTRDDQGRELVDEAVESLLNQFPDSNVMAQHANQMTRS